MNSHLQKQFKQLVLTINFIFCLISCSETERFYTSTDFEKVAKTDAHFHYLTSDDRYMKFADSLHFRLLTPIWDGEIPVDSQLMFSASLKKKFPLKYCYFGTFPVDSFNYKGFAERTINHIRMDIKMGASGIKIWKNIGMTLKDTCGKFILIDNPAFEPVFKYLEINNIPVIAHLGEPKDCWLAEEKMTDPGDASYYRNNPGYHMYLHPDVPSYDEQINARDSILARHPHLDFVGAHLGSIEWSVDELAKRLDKYPAFKVDLAARIFHLRYQSSKDRSKVRDFMIRYQDRILYGTDSEVSDEKGSNPAAKCENLKRGWLNDWLYFVTDSVVNGIQGLKLPAGVIDKIYNRNADLYFFKVPEPG